VKRVIAWMVAYLRPVGGRPGVYTVMGTYLFTFRPPAGYAPSADTFEVCELTSHDERFDQWLDATGARL
jgi:hypothetical protein